MKDLHERFLNQYFLFSAPIVKVMTFEQGKQAFFSLANAYLIDDESARALWDIVQSDEVRQIEGEKDYLRHCRTQQYMREFLHISAQESELH